MNRASLNRFFFAAAFALGLASLAWVGLGFIGTSALALAMTALIGAAYLVGAHELQRHRQASAGLARALAEVPQPLAALDDWLPRVPAALQAAVRQRIETERGALPGLALTPYLIGLLVMLGMLGTFLGMVITFKGVVFTLEGSADLQAIRTALAAPIKGLGLAFGTSVVGVATSAMLGLMSAIARRERAEALRLLDARVATHFRAFSLAHQRQATVDALQQQAQLLPAVVAQLQALVAQVEQRGQRLDEDLLARQGAFLDRADAAYRELARSVEQSLRQGLEAGARAAGENLTPVVSAAMAGMAQDTTRLHERLAHEAAQLQARVSATVAEQVQALADRFDARGEAALQRLGEQQAAFNAQAGAQLEQLGQALEAPMARLIDSATEAPRAAAEVMAQLRRELGQLDERDQAALQERATLMQQIDALLQRVQQTTDGQRAAIETLVGSAGAVLDQMGRQFADTVGAQAVHAEDVAARIQTSATGLAQLGEHFGQGVQRFSDSNQALMHSLQAIQNALAQSMARSDEQLAYYVAQAREVVDLSISAQQGIVEDLRRLRSQPDTRKAA
ncbi:hypothetical protein [Hydrogenophaga crocea]|uniref:hypothetical protein n=1 Tax=Hydrogenophaga crocea TaxID=2716225 RepID=UPI001F112D4C|nr:hypothetical protein [Hydrogenophaga crocea]